MLPIQILPTLWAERVLILTISIIYFGKFQPSSLPGPEFQPAPPAQAPDELRSKTGHLLPARPGIKYVARNLHCDLSFFFDSLLFRLLLCQRIQRNIKESVNMLGLILNTFSQNSSKTRKKYSCRFPTGTSVAALV